MDFFTFLVIMFGIFVVVAVSQLSNDKRSPAAKKVWLSVLLPFIIIYILFFLGVLTSTLLVFFKTLWINLNINTKQSLGIILSLIGLWFGGSSILGEDRLERWDSYIKKWIEIERENELRRLRKFSGRFTDRSALDEFIRRLFIILFLIWVGILLLPDRFYGENTALSRIAPVLLCIMMFGSFVAFLFLSIIPSLISVVLFILEIPYRLIAWIENKNSLNRTLLFLGLIFGSLGIIILET